METSSDRSEWYINDILDVSYLSESENDTGCNDLYDSHYKDCNGCYEYLREIDNLLINIEIKDEVIKQLNKDKQINNLREIDDSLINIEIKDEIIKRKKEFKKELNEEISGKDKIITTLNNEIITLNNQLTNNKNEINILQLELNGNKNTLGVLKQLVEAQSAKLHEYEETIAELADIISEFKQRENKLFVQLERRNNGLRLCKKELEEKDKKIFEMKLKINEFDDIVNENKQLQIHNKTLNGKIIELSNEMSMQRMENKNKVSLLKQQLDSKNRECNEIKNKNIELNAELNDKIKVVNELNKNSVKYETLINDRVCPTLLDDKQATILETGNEYIICVSNNEIYKVFAPDYTLYEIEIKTDDIISLSEEIENENNLKLTIEEEEEEILNFEMQINDEINLINKAAVAARDKELVCAMKAPVKDELEFELELVPANNGTLVRDKIEMKSDGSQHVSEDEEEVLKIADDSLLLSEESSDQLSNRWVSEESGTKEELVGAIKASVKDESELELVSADNGTYNGISYHEMYDIEYEPVGKYDKDFVSDDTNKLVVGIDVNNASYQTTKNQLKGPLDSGQQPSTEEFSIKQDRDINYNKELVGAINVPYRDKGDSDGALIVPEALDNIAQRCDINNNEELNDKTQCIDSSKLLIKETECSGLEDKCNELLSGSKMLNKMSYNNGCDDNQLVLSLYTYNNIIILNTYIKLKNQNTITIINIILGISMMNILFIMNLFNEIISALVVDKMMSVIKRNDYRNHMIINDEIKRGGILSQLFMDKLQSVSSTSHASINSSKISRKPSSANSRSGNKLLLIKFACEDKKCKDDCIHGIGGNIQFIISNKIINDNDDVNKFTIGDAFNDYFSETGAGIVFLDLEPKVFSPAVKEHDTIKLSSNASLCGNSCQQSKITTINGYTGDINMAQHLQEYLFIVLVLNICIKMIVNPLTFSMINVLLILNDSKRNKGNDIIMNGKQLFLKNIGADVKAVASNLDVQFAAISSENTILTLVTESSNLFEELYICKNTRKSECIPIVCNMRNEYKLPIKSSDVSVIFIHLLHGVINNNNVMSINEEASKFNILLYASLSSNKLFVDDTMKFMFSSKILNKDANIKCNYLFADLNLTSDDKQLSLRNIEIKNILFDFHGIINCGGIHNENDDKLKTIVSIGSLMNDYINNNLTEKALKLYDNIKYIYKLEPNDIYRMATNCTGLATIGTIETLEGILATGLETNETIQSIVATNGTGLESTFVDKLGDIHNCVLNGLWNEVTSETSLGESTLEIDISGAIDKVIESSTIISKAKCICKCDIKLINRCQLHINGSDLHLYSLTLILHRELTFSGNKQILIGVVDNMFPCYKLSYSAIAQCVSDIILSNNTKGIQQVIKFIGSGKKMQCTVLLLSLSVLDQIDNDTLLFYFKDTFSNKNNKIEFRICSQLLTEILNHLKIIFEGYNNDASITDNEKDNKSSDMIDIEMIIHIGIEMARLFKCLYRFIFGIVSDIADEFDIMYKILDLELSKANDMSNINIKNNDGLDISPVACSNLHKHYVLKYGREVFKITFDNNLFKTFVGNKFQISGMLECLLLSEIRADLDLLNVSTQQVQCLVKILQYYVNVIYDDIITAIGLIRGLSYYLLTLGVQIILLSLILGSVLRVIWVCVNKWLVSLCGILATMSKDESKDENIIMTNENGADKKIDTSQVSFNDGTQRPQLLSDSISMNTIKDAVYESPVLYLRSERTELELSARNKALKYKGQSYNIRIHELDEMLNDLLRIKTSNVKKEIISYATDSIIFNKINKCTNITNYPSQCESWLVNLCNNGLYVALGDGIYFNKLDTVFIINVAPDTSTGIDSMNKYAYIMLQENNLQIISIFSSYASDKDNGINILAYNNLYVLRQPLQGKEHILTANEGNSKYVDTSTVDQLQLDEYIQDPEILKYDIDANLGSTKILLVGEDDGSFNNDCYNPLFDIRPEQESIIVTECGNGDSYVFIGLERVGVILLYDITDIDNHNEHDIYFVKYLNTPSEDNCDIEPKTVIFISNNNSNGLAYLIVGHNTSASIGIYSFNYGAFILDFVILFGCNILMLYLVMFQNDLKGVIFGGIDCFEYDINDEPSTTTIITIIDDISDSSIDTLKYDEKGTCLSAVVLYCENLNILMSFPYKGYYYENQLFIMSGIYCNNQKVCARLQIETVNRCDTVIGSEEHCFVENNYLFNCLYFAPYACSEQRKEIDNTRKGFEFICNALFQMELNNKLNKFENIINELGNISKIIILSILTDYLTGVLYVLLMSMATDEEIYNKIMEVVDLRNF